MAEQQPGADDSSEYFDLGRTARTGEDRPRRGPMLDYLLRHGRLPTLSRNLILRSEQTVEVLKNWHMNASDYLTQRQYFFHVPQRAGAFHMISLSLDFLEDERKLPEVSALGMSARALGDLAIDRAQVTLAENDYALLKSFGSRLPENPESVVLHATYFQSEVNQALIVTADGPRLY